MTFAATEVGAMLALKLGGATLKILSAHGALQINTLVLFVCPEFIRAGTGTGGLSAPLKARLIGGVFFLTNWTYMLNFISHSVPIITHKPRMHK